MSGSRHGLDTELVHAGEPDPPLEGAVSIPVFQSSTFEYPTQQGNRELRYGRLSNTPNHLALHRKLAVVEGADRALVAASGMAAISTTLLALLGPGDHLMVQRSLYGGTRSLLSGTVSRLGIEVSFIDGADPSGWAGSRRPSTRMVMLETISNPLVKVGRLEQAAEFAREHGLISLVDNTFASPANYRPVESGFDLCVESCSKYLGGHSDLVAGAVAGRSDLLEEVEDALVDLGGCLDPHACFLLHRGMKTLGLRVERQNANAQALAVFLREHPEVERVHYPGIPDDPSHANACRVLDGCGGVLSFRPRGGVERASRFLESVRLPYVATSLGGVETLLSRPCDTSHAGLSPEERGKLGISDALIRVAVGIENADDLVEDFARALEA